MLRRIKKQVKMLTCLRLIKKITDILQIDLSPINDLFEKHVVNKPIVLKFKPINGEVLCLDSVLFADKSVNHADCVMSTDSLDCVESGKVIKSDKLVSFIKIYTNYINPIKCDYFIESLDIIKLIYLHLFVWPFR